MMIRYHDRADVIEQTFKEDSQNLSPSSHPHLRLEDCMVHIPRVYPGDTIWWFCDVCVPCLHDNLLAH